MSNRSVLGVTITEKLHAMAGKTKIEWSDFAWNPIRGCSRVSEGCRNCYAERVAARFGGEGQPYHGIADPARSGSKWTGKVALVEKALEQPLRWRRPRRIFVNSMSDLFHESVPDEWIDRIFAVMSAAPRHTFQILTKRPERMLGYLLHAHDEHGDFFERLGEIAGELLPNVIEGAERVHETPWPLPNVWLGVSVEDQKTADERTPLLLETPAAIRFVSAEPLLGQVRLDRIEEHVDNFKDCGGHPDPHWPIDTSDATWLNSLTGACQAEARDPTGRCLGPVDVGLIHLGGKLDWVICGGESGPGARPMHPDWARSLRDQCQTAGVPFFFKQWGEWAPQVGAVDGSNTDDDPELSRFDHCDWKAGRWSTPYRPAWCDECDDDTVSRIGKRRAGRLLDGREWNEFPPANASAGGGQ